MKNILIPTDFTTQSLFFVNKAAASLQSEKMNVILFHAFNLPDDAVDLMFVSREKIYQGLVSDDFRNQCRKLKNLYFDTIHSIHIKYMYGSTVRLLKNFIDANSIDAIVLPEDIDLQLPHKYSFNPVALLKKSGITIIDPFEAPRQPDAPHTKTWIPEQIQPEDATLLRLTKV